MKKVILSIFSLVMLIGATKAQTVNVDAESGNRAVEQGNCWGFGSVGYTSTAAQIINGKWSMRSNSPTNLDPGACWIKSPWIKPGSGKITFNIKFEAAAAATTRRIIASYISFNSSNAYGEGTFVRFDSTTYTYSVSTPLPTTTQSLSFAVPNAIANSSLPYKVQLSFVGTGGTTRYNIDDVVIPGTYYSDPTNNCLPKVEVVDADGDGVPDKDDAYPNDASRAYNTLVPTKEAGTLMFEDAWPNNGDYDFNDLVLGYQYTIVTNAKNNVVELKGKFAIRAIGARYRNGFAIQLDNLSPELIAGVKGTKTEGASWLSLNTNGTEAEQKYANIVVMDNVSRLVPAPSNDEFVNTETASKFITPDTTDITISFIEGKVTAKDISINPYLIINQGRGYEIHLAGKQYTNKADTKVFGTGDDNTSDGKGIYYLNKNNLPWALDVPVTIPYSLERKDITSSYLNLTKWAESAGASYSDWYLDMPDYRNSKNIYTK